MEARELHNWDVTPSEAREIQQQLATMISTKNKIGVVKLVAGVDISAPDKTGKARASAIVFSYPRLELIEVKAIKKEVTYPYIPGLLSFREAPLIIAACDTLKSDPDIIIVDGQGIAHPRRIGLASHLGLLWNKPTIGCAKSRLCGTHDMPSIERGDYTYLIDQGEIIGAVLRTRYGVTPVYVSIGHKIDLQEAIAWILNCCDGKRLPEPTRLAHIVASNNTKGLENMLKSNTEFIGYQVN